MPIFYLDYENGNDANSGANWGNAWKTITLGATAARIAPGDVIRIAKSPAPSGKGSATWTDLSKTVTIQAMPSCTFTDSGATKVRVTKSGHNLATGDIVVVSATEGGTYDGTYAVTYVGATTFDLDGTTYSADKTGTVTPQFTKTIDQCEADWTTVNATSAAKLAVATDAKEGSYCVKIVEDGTPAADQVQAYKATGTLNLALYQKISFWIKNEVAILADQLELNLCTGADGTGEVDTFAIPAIPSKGRWVCLTIAKTGGGNLNAAVESINISNGSAVTPYTASKYVYLDNIIACTTNGLNLQSLFSKCTLEQNTISATNYGNEGWFPIQSIVGNTILIDNETASKSNAGRGYSGTSETVPIFIRETIKTSLASAINTAIQEVQDSGSQAGGFITLSGGWDTSLNTKIGETYFDGLNSWGYGLYSTKTYISFERISGIRYLDSFCLAGIFHKVDYSNSTGNSNYAIESISQQNQITNSILNNNTSGISGTSNAYYNIVDTVILNNNLTYGVNAFLQSILKNITSKNNGSYGVNMSGSFPNNIFNLITSNNASGSINFATGYLWVTNATIAESTKVAGLVYIRDSKVFINNLSGYAYIAADYGTIVSQTTTRHMASGVAWQLSPTNVLRDINYPLEISLAKIAVNTGTTVTVKVFCKLSHGSDIGAKLICKGGQLTGIESDVPDTKVGDTDWEELSITLNPTETGVVEIIGQAYWLANTADESVYFDDLSVT